MPRQRYRDLVFTSTSRGDYHLRLGSSWSDPHPAVRWSDRPSPDCCYGGGRLERRYTRHTTIRVDRGDNYHVSVATSGAGNVRVVERWKVGRWY